MSLEYQTSLSDMCLSHPHVTPYGRLTRNPSPPVPRLLPPPSQPRHYLRAACPLCTGLEDGSGAASPLPMRPLGEPLGPMAPRRLCWRWWQIRSHDGQIEVREGAFVR
jgi:hypothetical protein